MYDLDENDILFDALKDSLPAPFDVIPVSNVNGAGLEELRRRIFVTLNIVRVYSKMPGKPADMKSPFTLPVGSNLLDFAKEVHNDFAQNLKFARIWGSNKFDGQKVQRDYIVQDRDIIELHTTW